MLKANDIVLIADIQEGTLVPSSADQLKGCYAEVIRLYPAKLGWPWTSAKINVLTGKLKSWKLVMSAVHLIPVDWSEPEIWTKLCRCKGEPGYHTPDSEGCLSKEQGPFCGCCGLPCEIASITSREREEFQGVINIFDIYEDESSCCKCQQIFTDCNLTKPWSFPYED